MKAARNLTERSVVLALPESELATEVSDRLRWAGWRVFSATSRADLRRLACRMDPQVVVLSADGADESGWLTCAKLLRAVPRIRAIVVGEPTIDAEKMARFVGVEALVPPETSAEELVDRIEGAVLQTA